MSFFGCCQGIAHEDCVEIKAVNLETKDIIAYQKEKSVRCLKSPKASLKCLTSLKSFKSKENFGQSKEMLLTSTVDLTNQQLHNQEKLITRRLTHQNLQQGTNHFDPDLLIPFSSRQTFPNASAPKEKIRLSFRNSKNPEQKIELPVRTNKIVEQEALLPIKKVQKKTNVLETTFCGTGTKILKQKSEIIKKSSSFNTKFQSRNKFTIPTIPYKKAQLGGSKYTLFSQEDEEQLGDDRQLKMEESAIILNVFNASQSQIKKWGDVGSQKKK